MVKISGFMAAVRFFHLLNIIAPVCLRNVPEYSPSSIGNNKKGLYSMLDTRYWMLDAGEAKRIS